MNNKNNNDKMKHNIEQIEELEQVTSLFHKDITYKQLKSLISDLQQFNLTNIYVFSPNALNISNNKLNQKSSFIIKDYANIIDYDLFLIVKQDLKRVKNKLTDLSLLYLMLTD